MRWALFWPTPGSTRNASMSCSSSEAVTSGPQGQNGIFMPGGRFMPAVAAAIFSADSVLTLLTASLNAAAIRSSAISGSDSTLGSIRTLRHSMRPDRVTSTMPPPAPPVTSRLASSSWARFTPSCIFCACCISWAMFPRMVFLRVWGSIVVEGADRVGHDAGARAREQPLHVGISQERAFGLALAGVTLALVALLQGLPAGRRRGSEADRRRGTEMGRQRIGQLLDQERCLQVVIGRRQREFEHAVGIADECSVRG